ncbi:hypothetical protein Aple_100580 [Acrocarpospora pleiomorpha]|uniref:Uncharacterized protein n=1 Tax=Acrocarpospora pleiomorpha TaxID=90975 RepID=A0A5M3Y435_9ACTN|nr:hypothetical protein [Acrocarpospora pleiomorpha]GES27159.1 hypothetical protein Aple_100580 [Acrocarpospora pleiomorpha]
MPRKTAEWKYIVREKSKEIGYIYGSAKAITYWLNRGFNSRNPKYCNTWTASTAQVSYPEPIVAKHSIMLVVATGIAHADRLTPAADIRSWGLERHPAHPS